MFDIGWLELMVIGIVALIVVGPKDLPGMFRTVGNFVGKARSMAREFQRTMEAAADESGLKEATETMKGLNDPLKQAQNSMKDYSKNFVTQKDQKAADKAAQEKVETAGEKLVKEASAIASPAAKSVAAKADATPPKKPAAKKAGAKKAPAKAEAAPKAKAASKAKAATKASPAKKPKPSAKAAKAKS